jgi:dTDP-4-amino-4,6-dideoxygalactose transaminase
MMIPHSKPSIDQEDMKAVSKVLASGKIAQGEKVKEFEEAMAKYVGTKFGVAVSSGTSALHLALCALGVGSTDEVILPSYVCSSPYFAVLHANAIPKLADIKLSDLNISSGSARGQLSRKTRAIIVPHMFGNPAELDDLREIGIPVIEDCAQSLGAQYRGHQVGSLTELSVFSFYATKMITSGEGGMALTNNRQLYTRIMKLRDYDRKTLTPVKYNYKMTDLQAALGLSQLNKLPVFIRRRREIAARYSELLSAYDIDTPPTNPHKRPVFYRYVVRLRKAEQIQKIMRRNGVICEKPVSKPLHRNLEAKRFDCPNSDKAFAECLSIPIYPNLSEDEIRYVLQKLEPALSKTRVVSK